MGKLYEINHIERGFEELKFIISALSKTQCNPAFSHIYVDKSNIYCTDGRRAHFINKNIFDFKDGYLQVIKRDRYKILLHETELNHTYPDIKKVIPKGTKVILESWFYTDQEIIKLIRATKTGLQLKFLNCFKDQGSFIVKHSGNDQEAFHFIGNNIEAVIMPMKL